MASQAYQRSGVNWFAVAAGLAVLMISAPIAWARVWDGDPGWVLALPVVGAVAIAAALHMRERALPTSQHTYTVYLPAFEPRTLGDLVGRVEHFGYSIAAADLGSGTSASAETGLGNAELRLRDRRAPDNYGELAVRLTVQPGGALLGCIDAIDTEPGLYDELAQYTIAAMSDLWSELEYSDTGSGARRRGGELRAELPEAPLGLGLLPAAAKAAD